MSSLADPTVPLSAPVSAALQRREVWFEKAAETAYQAVLAISQGQEDVAREEVDKLRLLRTILGTGESRESAATGVEIATPLSLQRMRYAVDAIEASQEVIAQWVRGLCAQLGDAEQMDLQGWHRLIDGVLPAAWNFEADILVVCGSVHREMIEALLQRGQRRVLFLLHRNEAADHDECPDLVGNAGGMRWVHNLGDVERYMENLLEPYPKQVAHVVIEQGRPCEADPDANVDDVLALIRKSVMTLWMEVNTRRAFARQWVENSIANLPAVVRHHNLHDLDGVFRGRPAILIAPGPSLDKNIEQIREAKGKALLIAPLQTLRRLYKADIQPDFVVVLDPSDLTTDPYDFFNDVPADFLTTLIVGFNCHPNVVRRFPRVYFFSTNGPLDHWLHEVLGEPMIGLQGASVAVSAMVLAQHWGCSPIVLTGQDLALADNGERYAKDAQLNNLSKPKLMTLPGYHGGTVQTPSDYFLFHHQFELIAKTMGTTHPGVRLCNCTEGGAYIGGYEHLTLREVMQSDVIGQPLTDWVALQEGKAIDGRSQLRHSGAEDHLRSIIRAVDACEAQAEACRRLTLRPNGSAAFLQKLQGQEQRLQTLLQSVKGFSIVFQEQIAAARQAGAEAPSLQANLAASRALYAVVIQGCRFIRPLLDQALKELVGPR